MQELAQRARRRPRRKGPLKDRLLYKGDAVPITRTMLAVSLLPAARRSCQHRIITTQMYAYRMQAAKQPVSVPTIIC